MTTTENAENLKQLLDKVAAYLHEQSIADGDCDDEALTLLDEVQEIQEALFPELFTK